MDKFLSRSQLIRPSESGNKYLKNRNDRLLEIQQQMQAISKFWGVFVYSFFKPYLILVGHYKNARYHPGYYYSSIVSVSDLKKRQDRIWKQKEIHEVHGIDFNNKAQLALVKQFTDYYTAFPFPSKSTPDFRYHLDNQWYPYSDGIVLYSMIRHYRPKAIIEVGSGYSSAVMLDTNDCFMDQDIHLTFIEPNTERLYSLLSEKDHQRCEIIKSTVQEVPLEKFKSLEKGDIFFVDSSHVGKTGSDVLHILFEILPVLKSGVLIHFHDVFYPFEYPKEWVFAGKNWNEDYLLRCFLMYNTCYTIKFFSHYLHSMFPNAFEQMPLAYKEWGSNLWIEKQ